MKFVVYLLMAFYFPFVHASNVKDTLAKISSEDIKSIKNLFYAFICFDHFEYTILGDKPIALSGHFVSTPWQNIKLICVGNLLSFSLKAY